jgi:hypothetical protein
VVSAAGFNVTIGTRFASASQNAPPSGSYYGLNWGWAPLDQVGYASIAWTGQ